MLFLSFRASLSTLAFSRPTCLFLGPMIHYSCCLGLMVLLPTLSILRCPCYWAFFLTNGPQHLAPWTYETFLRFICELKGVFALLSSHLFLLLFFSQVFFKLWTSSYIYTYIYIYILYIFSFLLRIGLSLQISQFGSYSLSIAAASLISSHSGGWPVTFLCVVINDLGI